MDNFNFNQYTLGIFECERKDFELGNAEAIKLLEVTENFVEKSLTQLPDIKESVKDLKNKLENVSDKLGEVSSNIENGYRGNIDLNMTQISKDQSNIKAEITKCENIINQIPSTEENLANLRNYIKVAKNKIQTDMNSENGMANRYILSGVPYKA